MKNTLPIVLGLTTLLVSCNNDDDNNSLTSNPGNSIPFEELVVPAPEVVHIQELASDISNDNFLVVGSTDGSTANTTVLMAYGTDNQMQSSGQVIHNGHYTTAHQIQDVSMHSDGSYFMLYNSLSGNMSDWFVDDLSSDFSQLQTAFSGQMNNFNVKQLFVESSGNVLIGAEAVLNTADSGIVISRYSAGGSLIDSIHLNDTLYLGVRDIKVSSEGTVLVLVDTYPDNGNDRSGRVYELSYDLSQVLNTYHFGDGAHQENYEMLVVPNGFAFCGHSSSRNGTHDPVLYSYKDSAQDSSIIALAGHNGFHDAVLHPATGRIFAVGRSGEQNVSDQALIGHTSQQVNDISYQIDGFSDRSYYTDVTSANNQYVIAGGAQFDANGVEHPLLVLYKR